jgi:hypothetical protein
MIICYIMCVHDLSWVMMSDVILLSNYSYELVRPGLHEGTKCVSCNERHDTAVEIERNQ